MAGLALQAMELDLLLEGGDTDCQATSSLPVVSGVSLSHAQNSDKLPDTVLYTPIRLTLLHSQIDSGDRVVMWRI